MRDRRRTPQISLPRIVFRLKVVIRVITHRRIVHPGRNPRRPITRTATFGRRSGIIIPKDVILFPRLSTDVYDVRVFVFVF
jgi:hypothetical protein